jgi:hypothetical protein
MKIIYLFISFILSLFFIGCATIINGSDQLISIDSNPANATVKIDGFRIGETPIKTPVKRKDNHIITIELTGYNNFETQLLGETSGWVFGNCLFGGIIGGAIDAATGSWYKFPESNIKANLQKNDLIKSSENANSPRLSSPSSPIPNGQNPPK